MFKLFKGTLLIVVGIALAAQLTGCFFVDRDDRHHEHHEYHHDSESGVDVHLHS